MCLIITKNMRNKYQCTTTSGCGTERDAGTWELKETQKTITFKYIDDLHFEPNYKLIRINKLYSKKRERKDENYSANREIDGYGSWANNGHVLRDWKDGTYTAYPEQCGTPYYFEPIKQKP
jgi:hypothetical protein